MRVMVLGVRGLPDVQGGVETHAANLYPALIDLGCDVEVVVRTPFSPPGQTSAGALKITRLWSPQLAGFETVLHSLIGVFYALWRRPDILHIHAIGPSIVTPIARFGGLNVVMTHHGPDYDRDKWGGFARAVLRLGERWGARYSNARIAISKVIADLLAKRFGQGSSIIPNGVIDHGLPEDASSVVQRGLQPGRYFLIVGRLVPEKRHLDLIEAFARADIPGWRLVIAGKLDKSGYCQQLVAAARRHQIVMTDYVGGQALWDLYAHAGAFVLPSTHEGLPIAMLEALSFGTRVIASDIPANLEIELDSGCYFQVGDVDQLARRLTEAAQQPDTASVREQRRLDVLARYNWVRIAAQTKRVYDEILGGAGVVREI